MNSVLILITWNSVSVIHVVYYDIMFIQKTWTRSAASALICDSSASPCSVQSVSNLDEEFTIRSVFSDLHTKWIHPWQVVTFPELIWILLILVTFRVQPMPVDPSTTVVRHERSQTVCYFGDLLSFLIWLLWLWLKNKWMDWHRRKNFVPSPTWRAVCHPPAASLHGNACDDPF